MSSLLEHKPKAEMTEEELQALEEAEFQTGPLSLLTQAVKNHTQILIQCRNNRKLFARVKALYIMKLNLTIGMEIYLITVIDIVTWC